jgi:hypothetical protein
MRTAVAGQSDPEDPDEEQEPSPYDNRSDHHDDRENRTAGRTGVNRGPGWPRRRM